MRLTKDGIITQQRVHDGNGGYDKRGILTSWIKAILTIVSIVGFLGLVGRGYMVYAQVQKNQAELSAVKAEAQKAVKELDKKVIQLNCEQVGDSLFMERILTEIMKTLDPQNGERRVEKIKAECDKAKKDLEKRFLSEEIAASK